MTMMTLVAAEEEGSTCSPGHTACTVVDGLLGAGQAIAGNAATAALEAVAQGLADGAVAFLEMISTWWMNAPGPDLDNPAVAAIQSDTGYFIAAFAIIGFFIGLIRMLFSMDFKKIMSAFAPIVALIVVTGVYAVALGALLEAGDSTAAWLLDRATDGDANLEILAAPVGEMGQNIGVYLIVSLLTFFGAIMNFLLMIFRDVIILVLLAFLPVVAASTGSVSGKQAFQKINAWLIALLLFKPVAAGIYALGLRMMTQDSEIEGLGGELQNYAAAMTGMLILALAGLALPALIKFISPAAAMGAAAFGGGAAMAGAATVAAGAAVVAGTGGAAAPAVAGGSAAGAGAAGGGAAGAAGAAGGGAASSGASGAGGGAAGAAGGGSSGAAGASESAGAGQAAGGAGGSGDAGDGVAGSTPGGAEGESSGDSGSGSGGSAAGSTPGGADSAAESGGGGESSAGGSAAGGADSAGSSGSGDSSAAGAASGGSSGGSSGGQGASSPAGASAAGGASASSSGAGSAGSGSSGGGASGGSSGSEGSGVAAGTPSGAESAGPSGSGEGGASGGGSAASGASQNTGGDSAGKSGGSNGQKTQQLKNVIDTGTASGAKINQAVEGDDGESNS